MRKPTGTSSGQVTLPPKLEAVLARLCLRLQPITKTKAVKLPYLVDVVASALLGRRITEGTHQTWEMGVVTREAWIAIQQGLDDTPLRSDPHPYSESGLQIRLRDSVPESTSTLAPQETAIVDWIAEQFGSMDAARLGLLTKALNSEQEQGSWGSNHLARVDEDAYARLADGWRDFSEQLPLLDFRDRNLWQSETDARGTLHQRLGL